MRKQSWMTGCVVFENLRIGVHSFALACMISYYTPKFWLDYGKGNRKVN
jgi:hypothetical protein